MNIFFCLTSILILVFPYGGNTQSTPVLQQKILQIISEKKAVIGVSINNGNGDSVLTVNGNKHFPMQSVFKLHIALAVLSKMDSGKIKPDQKIAISKNDLLPNLYSPIREQYPNGVALSIETILKYTVSESDNVGCEALLRLIGGPKVVEDYFLRNNFNDVSIKVNEEQQQGNWELQFQNWTTPNAANKVLQAFYYNRQKLLSKKSHHFIWQLMKQTTTGKKRLKGLLPPNIIVAHKTGSSGTNKQGVTAAVNDIGIVFLPNNKHFFISVFVTESKEDAETNEKIIADIAKAAWDYFSLRKQ